MSRLPDPGFTAGGFVGVLKAARPSVDKASEPIQTMFLTTLEKLHNPAETALDRLNYWLLMKACLERAADWPIVEVWEPRSDGSPDPRLPFVHRTRLEALDEVDKHVYRAQHEVVTGRRLSFPEITWRIKNDIDAERCIEGEVPLTHKPAAAPPIVPDEAAGAPSPERQPSIEAGPVGVPHPPSAAPFPAGPPAKARPKPMEQVDDKGTSRRENATGAPENAVFAGRRERPSDAEIKASVDDILGPPDNDMAEVSPI